MKKLIIYFLLTLLPYPVYVYAQSTMMTIGSVSGAAGDTIHLPINVVNFNNVGAISLAISYDITALTYLGIDNSPGGVTFSQNETAGILLLGWFDATISSPINIPNGKLVDLLFKGNGNSGKVKFITSGTRICDIVNELGNSLSVTYNNGGVNNGLIPTATTLSAINIDTSSCTLNGSVNANNLSTSVQFEYGTTSSYGTIVIASQSPITGSADIKVSANISGLKRNTFYRYRVKAINSAGTAYGADYNFTTTVQVTPVVHTEHATNVSASSAILNGVVNAGGSSTNVQFEYGTTTNYGNTITALESPVSAISEINVSAEINGLAQNTSYHFRVKATNSSRTNYGDDFVFTTYSVSSFPSASTFSATNISTNSATLNGAANPNNLSTSVQFEYGTTTSYGSAITAVQSPVSGSLSSPVSANLTGLTPNTLYHYRVKATNTAGTAYGADSTFTTLSSGITWQATSGPFPYKEILSLANSGNYIFAGTNGNGVYLTTDNGTNWTQLYNGLSNGIVRALAVNSSGYIFAGTDGGINISTNNGSSWTQLINGIGADALVQALAIDLYGNIIVGTATGGIFRSTDNGKNWTQLNNGLTTTNVHSLAINSGGVYFAGTVGGGIFSSTDGGLSWLPVNNGITNNTIWSLVINSSGTVFAGTYGGGVFCSTNNGSSWVAQNNGLPSGPDVYCLTINSAGTVFAGLGYLNLGVYSSSDNGSWSQSGLPSNNVSALTVSSTGYVYAGTYEAGVYRTSSVTSVAAIPLPPILTSPENGSLINSAQVNFSWNKSSEAITYRLEISTDSNFATLIADVHLANTSCVSVLYSQIKCYWRVNATNSSGTSDWSTTWSFSTINTPDQLVAITKSASNITYSSVTLNGTVNPKDINSTVQFDYGTTSSYGLTITASQSPVINDLNVNVNANITGLNSNTQYHFRVKITNSLGTKYGADSNFTTLSTGAQLPPTVTTLGAINVGSTSVILKGKVNSNGLTSYSLFDYGTTSSYGSTWAYSTADADPTIVFSQGLGNLLPNTLYHFRIEATNSAGTTYGEDSTFTTLPVGQGWQQATGTTSGAFNITNSSYRISGANLYAGVINNILLSTDNGISWIKINNSGIVDSAVIVSSIAVTPNGSNGTNLFAGIQSGGIFLSTNNGANWTPSNTGLEIKDVRDISVIGSNLFVGTEGGGVFTSMNNGSSWVEVNNGITNLFINALSVYSNGNGGSIICAGTQDAGLFISTNNGNKWTQTGQSILTINKISIASDGNGGNIICVGTITSGVYVSTNQGSTWIHSNTGLTSLLITSLAMSSNGAGGTNIFAGTNNGIYLSTNNGLNWVQVNAGISDKYILSLAGSGSNLIAGSFTKLYWASIESLTNQTTLVTSSATNIAQTSATLSGIINPNNLSTSAQFEFGTTTSYGSIITASQSPVTGNANVNVSADISGLNSNTLYHFRVKATNSAGTFYGTDSTFTTLSSNVQLPSVLTKSATDISSTISTLNCRVNANGLSTTVQFEYGTKTSYGSTATAYPVTGSSEVSDSAIISNLTPYTLYHFRAKATNSGGTSYGADMTFMTGFSYPASISLSKSYTFNDPTKTSSFKLMALPGNLSTSLTQFITGTAKQDWNAYYDNGDTSNYLKEFDNTSAFQFKPGSGYWVISKNAINISQSVSTVALNSDNSYSIALHSGWNIISNPFDKSIVWDSIISANSLSSNTALYGWNASWTTSGSLDPYQGYYFYNRQNLSSLKIPYNPNGSIGKVVSKVSAFTRYNETNSLKLSLESGSGVKSVVYISIDSTAKNDYDAHDILVPPGDFVDAGIALRNEKLSIGYKNLMKESRPMDGNGQTFDLIITDSQKDKITLNIDGVHSLIGNEVYLLDIYNHKLYNLKENNVIDLTPVKKSNYQLLIGNSEYINAAEKEILPKQFALYQNYPNPFNPGTTIEYSIPKTSNVSLKVYDILGKEVATLVNGQKTAGYYRINFTTSGNTVRLSSGVYFYRMQAGSFVETKKLLLLK